jgi:hypothetical protein
VRVTRHRVSTDLQLGLRVWRFSERRVRHDPGVSSWTLEMGPCPDGAPAWPSPLLKTRTLCASESEGVGMSAYEAKLWDEPQAMRQMINAGAALR